MSYKTTSTGITKISILNEITEIEIFEYYLGIRVQLNINIVSPTILRSDDKSPGCAFWYNGEKIKYIDRSKGINEDCFGIVKLIHGGNFNDTLLRIASDFNLFGRTPITTYKKDVSQDSNFIPLGKLKLEKKVFQYQIKDWSLVDKKYWKERYLDSRILNEWKVRSISSAFINGRCIYVYEPTDVGYVYEFDDGTVQFYFPFRDKSSKNKKFITNSNIILGWEKLPKSGENVIISKSYKDIILLSELYGFPSVAPIGEGAFLPKRYIESLKSRFTNVFILYDNDEAGERNAERNVNTYPNLIPIFFEKDLGKDTDEVTCNFGAVETQEILNQMIL